MSQYRLTMDHPNPNTIPNPLLLLHNPNPRFPYFAQQAVRVGLQNGDPRAQEFGYPPTPMDMQASIAREMEKERIRAEIIAEEIMRRKLLEDEVRRELMMERTLMFHNGGPFVGGPIRRLAPPLLTDFKHPGRFEDTVSPVRKIEDRNGFQAVPFQRDPIVAGSGSGVKLQEIEVKGVVATATEAKPSTNLAADKKCKAMAPTAISVVEVVKKQKTAGDWSCSLCQVTATSKLGLNDHLRGKKHLARERGKSTLRMGFGTGPLPQMTNTDRCQSLKVLSSTSLPRFGKIGETDAESSFGAVDNAQTRKTASAEENTSLLLNEPFVDKKHMGVVKAKKDPKPQRKFKYFCDNCQVGAFAKGVFNKHIQGKRHLAKLSKVRKVDKAAGGEASRPEGGKIEDEEARVTAEETVEGNVGGKGDSNPESSTGDQLAETLGEETIAPKTTDQGSDCMEAAE